MNIYISGISGTGMGPLALMAKAAGFNVFGSDLNEGAIYNELTKAGIEVEIGEQDGVFLKNHLDGLDWFVYTSALSDDHPELVAAREAGIKCTKRDDFTAFLVEKLGLKMVAIAGTHGKTTFTRGFAEGLGIKEPITSPSFTISKTYAAPNNKTLIHYDFYRLPDPGLMTEDLEENLSNPNNIVLVEWADSVSELLPKNHTKICINYNDDGTREVIL